MQQDLWFWQTAHVSHDTESRRGFSSRSFTSHLALPVGKQCNGILRVWSLQRPLKHFLRRALIGDNWGYRGRKCPVWTACWKMHIQWHQTVNSFHFLLQKGKKKRSQNSSFCFQIECLRFPMWRDFLCQRLFFISCLKSCNGKENILADFCPISSDTWERNFRSSQHFISIFNLEEAGNWNTHHSKSSD